MLKKLLRWKAQQGKGGGEWPVEGKGGGRAQTGEAADARAGGTARLARLSSWRHLPRNKTPEICTQIFIYRTSVFIRVREEL